MSDPGIPKGVFRPVLISSAAVLGACVLTWGIVGTLSQTEPEALVDPAPRLAVTGLATLTILSAASILATLILRGQRQLADRLDVLLLTDERVRGRAENDAEIVPLPSPDAVAAVRRLAARLTGTEG